MNSVSEVGALFMCVLVLLAAVAFAGAQAYGLYTNRKNKWVQIKKALEKDDIFSYMVVDPLFQNTDLEKCENIGNFLKSKIDEIRPTLKDYIENNKKLKYDISENDLTLIASDLIISAYTKNKMYTEIFTSNRHDSTTTVTFDFNDAIIKDVKETESA